MAVNTLTLMARFTCVLTARMNLILMRKLQNDVARDGNGAELFDGDAVTVIKDLKVKGSSMVIKRGTKVKSIRLTENPEEVDCKIEGSSIVLKTCFLKK